MRTHAPVTPYVGVWIETVPCGKTSFRGCVTPYVGVWIETLHNQITQNRPLSLLMWECGLKRYETGYEHCKTKVTPYVGVWIETASSKPNAVHTGSHSLCGSVD